MAAVLALLALVIGPQSGGLGVGVLCGSCAVGVFLLQATGLIQRYRIHQIEKLERKYRDKYGPNEPPTP